MMNTRYTYTKYAFTVRISTAAVRGTAETKTSQNNCQFSVSL